MSAGLPTHLGEPVRLLSMAPSGETYFVAVDGRIWLVWADGSVHDATPDSDARAQLDGFEHVGSDPMTWKQLDDERQRRAGEFLRRAHDAHADHQRTDRNGRDLQPGDDVRRHPDNLPGRVTGFSCGRVEVQFSDGIAARPASHELTRGWQPRDAASFAAQ